MTKSKGRLRQQRHKIQGRTDTKIKRETTDTEIQTKLRQQRVITGTSFKHKINRGYYTRQDSKFRLCRYAPETIQHIKTRCKMLAGSYMELSD